MANKIFGNISKPFLAYKGHFNHQDTFTSNNRRIKSNEMELIEVFNNDYYYSYKFV